MERLVYLSEMLARCCIKCSVICRPFNLFVCLVCGTKFAGGGA